MTGLGAECLPQQSDMTRYVGSWEDDDDLVDSPKQSDDTYASTRHDRRCITIRMARANAKRNLLIMSANSKGMGEGVPAPAATRTLPRQVKAAQYRYRNDSQDGSITWIAKMESVAK